MTGFPDLVGPFLSAVVAAGAVRLLVPPPSRLADRVRPYSTTARGHWGAVGPAVPGSSLARVFGPMLRRTAHRLGRVVDRLGEAELARLLRNAGWYPGVSDPERVAAYRLGQLRSVGWWTAGGLLAAAATGLATPQAVALALLGGVVGVSRPRARLLRAIEERRRVMRIEIYTVDQLLALRIRAGGGIVQSVAHLVARGRGEVVGELAEVLRLHAAGESLSAAFLRVAASTPEPACARTYSLLAVAGERGVDLASGLLELAEDVREARREAIRRTATKRRAAMLVPTILVLAPVMLLFVGAPLPSLLLGFR